MPEVIEVTTYSFSELSEEAKQAARDWFVSGSYPHEDEWYEAVQHDAISAFACLGIEAEDFRFSGFGSQGDGASFKGKYCCPGSHLNAIKEYAPQDETLHAIASRLDVLQVGAQLQYNTYWSTTIYRLSSGYCHSGTMMTSETILGDPDNVDLQYDCAKADKELQSCMRALADWHYRQLEAEWDYLHENTYIDECIAENGYRFDEAGAII